MAAPAWPSRTALARARCRIGSLVRALLARRAWHLSRGQRGVASTPTAPGLSVHAPGRSSDAARGRGDGVLDHARATSGRGRVGHPLLQSRHAHPPSHLRRSLDPRPQGPGARQAAPGHVHAHRQPAARGAGGDRQRGRRGPGRGRQAHRRHAARRRLGERGRRRPRHSLRPAPGRRRAGGRDRLHAAARRRQVRQGRRRRLQLFRRPARRGRQRDQRAGQAAGGDGLARRPAGHAGLCRRRRASSRLTQAKVGDRRHGTRVRVWPDVKYFDSAELPRADLVHLLRSKAVLMPGVTVTLTLEKTGGKDAETTTWLYQGGLRDYLHAGPGRPTR